MGFIIIHMRIGIFTIIFGLLVLSPGCKKKENNIIHQAYEQPLKTYKSAKSKVKQIEKEHLNRLKAIEDSLK